MTIGFLDQRPNTTLPVIGLLLCGAACSSSSAPAGTDGASGGSGTSAGATAQGGNTASGGAAGANGGASAMPNGGNTASGGAAGGAGSGGAPSTPNGGNTASGGAAGAGGTGQTPLKPRMIALTDISTWETDDHESLTRLLAHADLFEIEGLVLSTGWSIDNFNDATKKNFINIIGDVTGAYEKDLPNLLKRSNQVGHASDDAKQPIGYWPSPKYLRDRTMYGSLNRGAKFLGANNDSDGSKLIIKLADEADDRPLWVTVWGGGNTVAQAIWRVKQERSPEALKAFLHKLRIYAITDQDRAGSQNLNESSHAWMRNEAKEDLLFIWDECAWKFQNGTGKSNWGEYTTHIQGHGNLGSQYPKYAFGVEGDTPAFLYIMPTGLNDPNDPKQCSWGGTFKGDANGLWQPAGSCGMYNGRFYPASFNNFAARMDWAKDGAGNRNPAIILDGDGGTDVVKKTPKSGAMVTLDASKTSDPDGNTLKFNWWVQADAGSYSGKVNISNGSTNTATVEVPADSAGKTFHVILEVVDDGTHNLSAYRRIIFQPTE